MAINDMERIQIDRGYSALAKTPRGDDIRKLLNAHPSIRAAEEKQWLNHLVYRPVNSVVEELVCWYLWVEDKHDTSFASQALNLYLDSEVVKTTFCVWVFGIKPQASFHFGDVSLFTVEEMSDSQERDEYLARIANFESPVPYAAVTIEKDLPRVVDDGKEASRVRQDLIKPSWTYLREVASLVNGLSGLSCLPHWECVYGEEGAPFGPWAATSKSKRYYDVVGLHNGDFSNAHSKTLGELIKNFGSITAEKKKQWIQGILQRIRKSKRQAATEGKILDLSIAAESLLLKNQSPHDPISLAFRLRGSWLLGRNFEDRQDTCKKLKTLYNYRCQIAHEGSFKNSNTAQNAHRELSEFYRIVEEILYLAICSSFPSSSEDWEKLILGQS